MNAAGGGTNKPRDNKGIQGFAGGGLVGGTAGNPPNAKKKDILPLDWWFPQSKCWSISSSL